MFVCHDPIHPNKPRRLQVYSARIVHKRECPASPRGKWPAANDGQVDVPRLGIGMRVLWCGPTALLEMRGAGSRMHSAVSCSWGGLPVGRRQRRKRWAARGMPVASRHVSTRQPSDIY